MLPLNRHTVIGEVLTRCWQIPHIDYVICTIPVGDDALATEAMNYADVMHGPEHDVLQRYYIAATEIEADIIMRITADCPLLCPEMCGYIMEELIEKRADYASNVHPRTFPVGYDCECFTYRTLERAEEEAAQHQREHVTTWMLTANIKRHNVDTKWKMDGRLTLDTEDDYRTICRAFGHEPYKRLSAA